MFVGVREKIIATVVVCTIVSGCMQVPGYVPVGMPYRPINPTPIGPGGGYPVGVVPGPPGGFPVTGYVPTPSGPVIPATPSGPPSTPTVPVSNPTTPGSPGTSSAPGNAGDYWVAWPLPPRNNTNVRAASNRFAASDSHGRPMRSTVRRGSESADNLHRTAGLPGQEPSFGERVSGLPSTPAEDLKYRGGRTIQHLQFVNLYVGGDDAWSRSDVESIDRAIAAAMADQNLNNVMMQYFNNQQITSKALPSHPLTGYRPERMTQGDVEYCLDYLASKGYLDGYDTNSTVFNFLLPRGAVLTDDTGRDGTVASAVRKNARSKAHFTAATQFGDNDGDEDDEHPSVIPHEEESSSLYGLGGYHGSIRKSGRSIYYSVDVYSERRSDGTTNGIPVFTEPWKNIVATLYHELNEARTDPDVGDAIRNPTDPAAERYLGWTSDRGEECGDYPIDEAQQLSTIVREVPLTDGSGTVPVQFQYSNAVHGPEGPIPAPHPLR